MVHEERRDYTPGDNIRRLDHKLYARSNRWFVKNTPQRISGLGSPLYVLVDSKFGGLGALKLAEMIEVLKNDGQREVFLGSIGQEEGHYVKLNPKQPTINIVDALWSLSEKNGPGPAVNAKLPRNLLVISESVGLLLAWRFLYSGHIPNYHSLWLSDQAWDVYPLIR